LAAASTVSAIGLQRQAKRQPFRRSARRDGSRHRQASLYVSGWAAIDSETTEIRRADIFGKFPFGTSKIRSIMSSSGFPSRSRSRLLGCLLGQLGAWMWPKGGLLWSYDPQIKCLASPC